jgi:hypothetical protein
VQDRLRGPIQKHNLNQTLRILKNKKRRNRWSFTATMYHNNRLENNEHPRRCDQIFLQVSCHRKFNG